MESLEPLPETVDALQALGSGSPGALESELVRQGERVQVLVPSLSGLSMILVRDGLTFTIAATPAQLALLDAVQYTVGGPILDAVSGAVSVLRGDDKGLLDEQRWVQFARVGAAHGVRSTLSIPVLSGGLVQACVNLYAADPDAFFGSQKALAEMLGGWAPGMVRNADLSFSSRGDARDAPQVLEDLAELDKATGMVMASRGVDKAAAQHVIADAARRAGVDALAIARELVAAHQEEGCEQ